MKKFTAVLLVLIICLGSLCACSEQKPMQTETDASTVAETEPKKTGVSDFKKIIKLNNYKGEVYITKDSKPVFKCGTGKTANSKGTKINEKTAFCIASVTKQFTAAAILQLREKGLLSLDDTIDLYFPDYKQGKKITIHNLLSMRSGIPDYIYEDNDVKAKFKVKKHANYKKNRRQIEKWIFRQKLVFTPDKYMQYSNSNYLLLAEIVEQVSGMGWGKYIRKHFFNPLGMKHSGFLETYNKKRKNFAWPLKGIAAEYLSYNGASFGTGDIISTAKDLAKWLDALDGGQVLSKESFKLMTTSYSNDADLAHGYGYGLMISDSGRYFHTGAITSYNSLVAVDKTTRCHLIMLTNTNAGNLETLARKFLTALS